VVGYQHRNFLSASIRSSEATAKAFFKAWKPGSRFREKKPAPLWVILFSSLLVLEGFQAYRFFPSLHFGHLYTVLYV